MDRLKDGLKEAIHTKVGRYLNNGGKLRKSE